MGVVVVGTVGMRNVIDPQRIELWGIVVASRYAERYRDRGVVPSKDSSSYIRVVVACCRQTASSEQRDADGLMVEGDMVGMDLEAENVRGYSNESTMEGARATRMHAKRTN